MTIKFILNWIKGDLFIEIIINLQYLSQLIIGTQNEKNYVCKVIGQNVSELFGYIVNHT